MNENKPDRETLFDIYPNPGSGNFILDIRSDADMSSILTVADISGKQVYSQALKITAGDQKINLDLNHLPEGIYFVHATGLHLTHKLVVVK